MSNLTTNLKTHIIITFTGGKYFITQEQYNVISKMDNNKKIILPSAVINTNVISEIQTINEYYNNHPDERPQFDNYDNKKLPERLPYSAKRHFNALNEMKKGFLRHFIGRTIPEKSQAILDNINEKIKNFKHGDITSPAQIFFGNKN